MDEQPSQVVSEHKDLGIIIDSNLKFHSQSAAATNKANRVLGLIKKSLNSLNSRTLPILFKALVIGHTWNMLMLSGDPAILEIARW